MTVQELIDILKTKDPSAEIIVAEDDIYCYSPNYVEEKDDGSILIC